MTLTPLTLRAKNRLRDHTLEISREGILNGQSAVLTHCIDHGCGWTGLFKSDEISIGDYPYQSRPSAPQEKPYRLQIGGPDIEDTQRASAS